MKLPEKFQFRVSHIPGFTHSIKLNANGDYEVSWARGYPNHIRSVPRMTWDAEDVQRIVESGGWIIVDDKPKQEEAATKLPDEFYFQLTNHMDKEVFRAKRSGENHFIVTWQSSESGREGMSYSKRQVEGIVASKVWTIVDKPSLTPEQQRALKEYKERIVQLDASIRINEQSVEHYNRMIANYKEVQEGLRQKVKELEGE